MTLVLEPWGFSGLSVTWKSDGLTPWLKSLPWLSQHKEDTVQGPLPRGGGPASPPTFPKRAEDHTPRLFL